ncbi:MAG: hypothetical protein K8T26_07775 [Lentisphaerae bacterium]|nr:hypothetical protein [Lentisphaerota bacterium]
MLLTALIVGGAMIGTLAWFFRRLRSIEEEFLGPDAHPALGGELRSMGTNLLHRMRKR